MHSISFHQSTSSTAAGVAPAKEKAAVDQEREARVAELRNLYRDGAYRVDARATAAAILNHHVISKPRA